MLDYLTIGCVILTESSRNTLHVNLNPIALEADIAYFSARLELVGDPATYYQLAQIKVYRILSNSLQETLMCLRGSEARS